MRRKPNSLVPLEAAICSAAAGLRVAGVDEFHGYELAKQLADHADRKLLTAYGTLYRALGRLESMGLLTSRREDPFSLSDGFDPIRHRLGIAYDDECIELGLTWRRDYETSGDARRGNSFLIRVALRNLGR